MKCVFCLIESKEKKNFVAISSTDKKNYKEFTNLDLNILSLKKVCKSCKSSLKSSIKFLQTCIKSHEKLVAESEKKQENFEARTKKTNEESNDNLQDQEDSFVADQIFSDDEDNLPIATLQQQIQNIHVQIVPNIEETEHIEEEQESFSEIKVTLPKKTPAKFLCPECGIPFQTSQRLQVHSFTHTGIKNFKCEFDDCEKSFATSFRLKAHTRTHTGEKPFSCSECPLSFAQGNALKCHKRIHSKERPFSCSMCSKSFAQNTTLKTHVAALHTGKKVQCDEPGCDKKFTRRSYLILHKRDHQGLRKYACDRCPNHYKQKSHLDRHIEATHLGIRHKCDFPGCSSEFSKAWSLKMHKFTHQPENLLPYNCQVCNASFQRRDKWLKHISKSHPEESIDLKKNVFEIQEIDTKVQDATNFVVLASTPEIFTIQNADGSFTHVQTLQIVKEN